MTLEQGLEFVIEEEGEPITFDDVENDGNDDDGEEMADEASARANRHNRLPLPRKRLDTFKTFLHSSGAAAL